MSLMSPALVGRFLTTSTNWEYTLTANNSQQCFIPADLFWVLVQNYLHEETYIIHSYHTTLVIFDNYTQVTDKKLHNLEKQCNLQKVGELFKHKQSDPSGMAKVADGWMATTSFVY